ncbi:uncharacterized protein LOC106780679 [Vigna radiata var. radiata]|uniref:Uncharacterized protein LOC106780679 n=1 Tax=Vigna radiata var. radiata TaxID=3916 RepID=A0A1S3W1T9_VIGRR|nr:uncharacterized protein LOC106780679 [Vigna radiata var. radiata]
MAYFGYMEAIDTWQLRTVVDRHTCSREHKLGLFNAKWLSKILEKTLKKNPNVKGVDIRDKISRKWNIEISKNIAYRAKAYASDEVEGSFTMPIIGLDGAFFKGRHRGELLTAVARDANNQMMPLTYAIVEVENNETWTWFIELLIEDLGGPKLCSSLTLISDQLKGLLPIVQDLVPGITHKFCVRHLYANFKKKFPGKIIKKLMWRASMATHPQKWENEMRSIKEVNEDVFCHLIVIPPRSRFNGIAQCDTLTNNMSGAFNSALVHTRTKPIITMLEEIRLYIMKRWVTNRSRLLYITNVHSWSAHKLFEVIHVSQTGDKYVVNIDEYSCSCRKWSISGIPCVHALAAMRFLNLNEEDYVPVCFLTSMYEEIYSSIIYPINGNNLWVRTKHVVPRETNKMFCSHKEKNPLHWLRVQHMEKNHHQS